MLKENTFDQKRGTELSDQILPIIGFDIKEEKFLKRTNTLHRYFPERTYIKKLLLKRMSCKCTYLESIHHKRIFFEKDGLY